MATVKTSSHQLVTQWSSDHSDRAAALQQSVMASFWSAAQWQQVRGSRYRVAACYDGDTCIGAAVVSTVLDEAELETVFVHPDYRSEGVAAQLLDSCFSRVRAGGIQSVFLEVDADNNAAINLYQRLGFATIDCRVAYYTHSTGNGDALVMRLKL